MRQEQEENKGREKSNCSAVVAGQHTSVKKKA
jgi:hypothetical protein